MVYLCIFTYMLDDFYDKCTVGKCTSPMDPMGYDIPLY